MANLPRGQQKTGQDAKNTEDIRQARIAQERRDNDMVRWTRAVAIFTFFLVIATAVGGYFIYWQYRVANDAQADMREQLKAVVSFVGEVPLTANFVDGKPTIYGFVTTFHNYGSTRTSKMKAWASVHYFEGSVPNSQDFSKPFQSVDVSNVIIGAGADFQLTPITLSPDEAQNVMEKKGLAIIWGHADWSDIFRPDINHTINFCASITPLRAPDGKLGFQTAPFRADCNNSQ